MKMIDERDERGRRIVQQTIMRVEDVTRIEWLEVDEETELFPIRIFARTGAATIEEGFCLQHAGRVTLLIEAAVHLGIA